MAGYLPALLNWKRSQVGMAEAVPIHGRVRGKVEAISLGCRSGARRVGDVIRY